ncbi:sialate O-acetylesterase [Mongoliitalea daihaiensis]|uniref:sialate O-acetylesterase n=1 Tax=Mongoliitalea daihaiensis TaxID=2782006 RepID=UPI001F1C1C33|nr:sialate O-acetylesterase [Mongoliitalea daihaiensis]UJP65086.1 sialate O-acetylesterase [Mongoliitalea daihaiensis]
MISSQRATFSIKSILVLIGVCFLAWGEVYASLRLPKLISDGMVLQREQTVKIWGWAEVGQVINVQILGEKLTTTAGVDGSWEVVLEPQQAGGPYKMMVSTLSESIQIQDVWFGDVWLTSGQSNMETTMERVSPLFPEEFQLASYPTIRYFDVPDRYNFVEGNQDFSSGTWLKPTKETLPAFSAIGYFFAKNVADTYQIPVGIINASVGGSPIQAWLPKDALKKFRQDYEEAAYFARDGVIEALEKSDREKKDAWTQHLNKSDLGLSKDNVPWFDPLLDDSSWRLIPDLFSIPELEGELQNGVFWFRKEIVLTEAQIPDLETALLMGTMVDSDQTFVNGVMVGSTGYQYPPRRYTIPVGVLKPGKNVLTVRLVSERGKPRFIEQKPYSLAVNDGFIELEKDWKFAIGAVVKPAPNQTSVRLKPLGLFQGMIHPLKPISFTGILWYQGESNTGAVEVYEQQFHELIDGWRRFWNRSELPFIFVQLPNFMQPSNTPQESNWAKMREIQRKSLQIPYTGMAITIDVGEANDIHPLDKKSVGDRLALQARKLVYNFLDGPFSGPLVGSATIKERKIHLTFSEVGKGLEIRSGDSLKGFAIADESGRYHWCKASIISPSVIEVSVPEFVKDFKSIRYAWADNPTHANLVNHIGLPASPFQLDLKP